MHAVFRWIVDPDRGFGNVPAMAFERIQAPPAGPQANTEMTENCPGLVANHAPRVIPAAFSLRRLRAIRSASPISAIGTFLIESPRIVRIATDYNDYVRPPMLPDVVTMNYAHSTHYTDHPDPSRIASMCCAAGRPIWRADVAP